MSDEPDQTTDQIPRTLGAHLVYLGLGSNLGDRLAHLRAALRALAATVSVERVSSVYDTAPQHVADQPRFLNLVCAGHTALDPLALLREAKRIEAAIGRVAGPRFGPRVIDIDLLLYDTLVLDTLELTLPHPRLAERAFVLLPLAEIAPRQAHPALGRDFAALARAVDNSVESADVRRVGPLPPLDR